jgi:hypothetical protein
MPVILVSVEPFELSNGNHSYQVDGWFAVDFGCNIGTFATESEALHAAFILGVPVVKMVGPSVTRGINKAQRNQWIKIIEMGCVTIEGEAP